MDQSPKILLQEDPRAFMDIVKNHDPQVRVNSLHSFDDMMTCEFLRHGIFEDLSELPGLIRLYNEFFLPAPVARRKEVYCHVKMIVSRNGRSDRCGLHAVHAPGSTMSASFQLRPSTTQALGL